METAETATRAVQNSLMETLEKAAKANGELNNPQAESGQNEPKQAVEAEKAEKAAKTELKNKLAREKALESLEKVRLEREKEQEKNKQQEIKQ